jgi:hypothetical protein
VQLPVTSSNLLGGRSADINPVTAKHNAVTDGLGERPPRCGIPGMRPSSRRQISCSEVSALEDRKLAALPLTLRL